MESIKKLQKSHWSIVFLFLLYLFTRLYHLLILPIFTDESIYIYWAKIIETTHSQWFLSLGDGKPPLLIWMIAIFLKILPNGMYLLAGRSPSVIAGGIGFFTIYLLTKELFDRKKTALIAAFFYIITPFILFYDRMALFDSLLSAMLLVSVYFVVRTNRTLQIKDAVLWGLFLGLSFLSKPTAIVFLGLTPLVFLLLNDKKTILKNWKKYLMFIAIAVVESEIINNIQRISHAYAFGILKDQQFQLPLSELLKNPFKLVGGNFPPLISWTNSYMTPPLFIVGIISLIFIIIFQWRKGLFLTILWLVPIYAFATVGLELFPRYILFVTPYMLIAIAYVFTYFFEKNLIFRIVGVCLLLGVIILPLQFDYYVLINPVKAPFPKTDYDQYVGMHPSGYGLDQIYTFIDEKAKLGKVTLATQGTFGLYPYAFTLYYWGNKNVNIIAHYPLTDIDHDIVEAQKYSQVYIVFKDFDVIPLSLPVRVVLKVQRAGGGNPIFVTQLTKRP